MATWLVAVDGSDSSHQAFTLTVQMMNKEKDLIYVLGVVERLTHKYTVSPAFFATVQDSQTAIERETKNRLRIYATNCEDLGVKRWSILVGTSPNVGDLICKSCEIKNVDTLVVGRKGSNVFSRFLTGSTSKYCMEHATCNVLVARNVIPPEEIHVNKEVVIKAEEEERERRENQEKEEKDLEEKEDKNRSEMNRNISRMAEDEERRRRIKEDEKVQHRNAEREAKLIGALVQQKHDRKMKETQIPLDDKHSKHSDLYELMWDD